MHELKRRSAHKLHATPACKDYTPALNFSPFAIFDRFTLCPPTRSSASPPSSGKPTHSHMALLTGPCCPGTRLGLLRLTCRRPTARLSHCTPSGTGHARPTRTVCTMLHSTLLRSGPWPAFLHGELKLQPERIFHPARHLLPATSRVAARTRHCPVPAHQLMMSAQSHETQRAAPDLHCGVEHNPQ